MNNNIFLGFLFIILMCSNKGDKEINTFSNATQKIEKLPSKNRLWIYIMAGQSNMAGRALIEPQDTVTDSRIITLNKDNKWIVAKEPLHFYESAMAGLDCGLSFGRELINTLNDSIVIAMIPCAVGDSSIDQWIGDSLHRGVRLLSNLKAKIDLVQNYGVIKGVLWHQGESDASKELTPDYSDKLRKLFLEFRNHSGNDSLPVLIGKLGAFATPVQRQEKWNSLNCEIDKLADADENIHVIETCDLADKGDNLHFSNESQRIMGKRFAQKYIDLCKIK